MSGKQQLSIDSVSSAGAAAGSAAERAAAAQAAAAGIVADLERRLAAAAQPGPEGGLKALALPAQVPLSCNCTQSMKATLRSHVQAAELRRGYKVHTCHHEHVPCGPPQA